LCVGSIEVSFRNCLGPCAAQNSQNPPPANGHQLRIDISSYPFDCWWFLLGTNPTNEKRARQYQHGQAAIPPPWCDCPVLPPPSPSPYVSITITPSTHDVSLNRRMTRPSLTSDKYSSVFQLSTIIVIPCFRKLTAASSHQPGAGITLRCFLNVLPPAERTLALTLHPYHTPYSCPNCSPAPIR